ncbi:MULTISPECIES: translation initiation factor IF-2 N-terminal domain-containing protein [Gordonia]|uniref:Ribonuclease E n=1 Tax=Gordonia sihwensis NBRC 108236 TaxID=1223544 RepID=L7LKG2_9ACTN|nr:MULTISPECIES: translation initiation factor IF-2 N-terminal domain-containing protein [Gordonia]AUH69334.1 ribonuclease E [Gordonia sp. YC-JH1]GAC61246.1 putative ribonuclease [Gordonia sihwensis NBRC 108236]
MTDNGSSADATSADQPAEKFPLRLRVHALARTLGLTSKQVLAHLQEMGVTARTAQSSISRADAEAVELRISGAVEDAADEAGEPGAPSLFSAVETPQPVSTAKAEATAPLFLAADADETAPAGEKTAEAKNTEAKKAGGKKSDGKKADSKKSDGKKADGKKAEGKKAESKKAETTDIPESDGSEKQADKKPGKKKASAKKPKKSEVDEAGTGDETPAAPETATAPVEPESEVPAAGGEDDEQTSGESESRSRRRRRGRRGRGRGRGDQGPEGSDSESDDAQDGVESDQNTAETSGPEKNGPDDDTADADQTQADATGSESDEETEADSEAAVPSSKRRRRRRRRRGGSDSDETVSADDPPNTVVHEREPRAKKVRDEVQGISGSTRLEAKRQRRRDGRDAGRRRPPILTESEFLARRESVERVMVVRERAASGAGDGHDQHAAPVEDYTQIAVLEDGVLVEHFVTTETSQSMVGNIYLGRVQNVLPGMEAAFVDIGRGRNGVLYAGEVNWEAAGLDGGSRKIEQALKPGDHVLVQVSKDPIGHKGARLTTQISLAGRYLVYVPGGTSTGISRKLPDTERKRLKQILAKLVPDEAGVIIRTASEGVSAEELGADIERLEAQWKSIEAAADDHRSKAPGTPKALYEEPDLLVRVVRDLFNEDFRKLVVEGERAWSQVSGYVNDVAPDLAERLERFTKAHADAPDSFTVHRIDEQLAKALDRKVWLPSGGTLIIEHTEAMTVVDVNTGKFTGSGGNLEETVTRNNLEAAEEIVRQMRLRDIGGMIIVDFIDMVLESNRDLVLRRLTETLARDRTRHQVSEVTSLGLVQMTRKRLGTGLLEAFSTTCTACSGRGVIVHANPVEVRPAEDGSRNGGDGGSRKSRRSRRRGGDQQPQQEAAAPAKPAPHKPAAEHPLFRAMAHPDDHDEHDAAAEPAADTSVPEVKAPEVENAEVEIAEVAVAEVAATDGAVSEIAAEVVVETMTQTPEPPVAVVTRRRRRAVRRAAAPTTAVESVDEVAEHEPVTTVAEQSAEPVVAVTRSPRRRSGRRAAGPPPTQQ